MDYNWIGNAGHGPKNDGGFDPGAIGTTGLREADATKRALDFWLRYMQANGAKVVLALQDGDLADVYNRANQVGAETAGDERFISFHNDSFSNPTVGGYSPFIFGPGGEREALAQLIDTELRSSGLVGRGVKIANFAVLRETNMPAVLVELGFISNPGEEALLKDDNWLRARMKEVARACLKHEGKELTVDPFDVPTSLGQTRPVLSKGAKGPAVVEAQNRLIAWGYVLPKWGADGDYGDETIAAVKAFQVDHGLQVDGWVGQNTWNELLKEPQAAPVPEPAPAPAEPPAPAVDPEKEALKAKVAELEKYKAAAEKDLETMRLQLISENNRAISLENALGAYRDWVTATKRVLSL